MTSASSASGDSGTARTKGRRGAGVIGAGRPGPVRKATREALAAARAESSWRPALEVRAVLAEQYAALVDRAGVSGDAPGLLRAGDKLSEILAGLPLDAGGGEPD